MAESAPKQIGVEQLATRLHVDLGNGIEQTVPRIVDPDIDALEMMQS